MSDRWEFPDLGPRPLLRRGDVSAEVANVQWALVELHYLHVTEMVPCTFDASTESALKCFQTSHGLPGTGELCTATRQALFQVRAPGLQEIVGSQGYLHKGHVGVSVSALKQMLLALGYLDPDDLSAMQVLYDEKTDGAVREFQWNEQLFENGVVGRETMRRLLDLFRRTIKRRPKRSAHRAQPCSTLR